jgi:hypothetical protein
MTDDEGKVLKACHTRMALLDSHYKSMREEFGELGGKVDVLTQTAAGNDGTLGGLERAVREEVLPAVRNFPRMISSAIENHEDTDPIHKAFKKKAERDIARMFKERMKSDPPKPDHEMDEIKKQGLVTRNRLRNAIAGLIIAVTSIIGTAQVQSCSQQDALRKAASEKGEK